ncbi:response regulator transcription factor [Persicobacter diffluens]|uniref:DNA-binding response regulator n=1 Tax=Persicobacter diffluens TaxID=981 RepID=A0AAN5ALB8_9BACT|nr:DNA-binding response regulator [Persicobacter diffluens]
MNDRSPEFDLLLVDDHPIVSAALEPLIKAIEGASVIGIARDGEEGLSLYQKYKPELVIADIDMPKMNGVTLAKKIKKINPDSKIIFITSHSDLNTLVEAMDIEVNGFIFKENAMADIQSSIIEVLKGNKYHCKEFEKFINLQEEKIKEIRMNRDLVKSLTKTEMQILQLIAIGKTSPQISESLFKSIKTIENHRYNICKKLQVTGNNQLLAFAFKNRQQLER